MIASLAAGLLLLMQNTPMCGPGANTPNALCQDTVIIPPPSVGGTPAPVYGVEVYLEDGGKPASRPEIRYSGCGAARRKPEIPAPAGRSSASEAFVKFACR